MNPNQTIASIMTTQLVTVRPDEPVERIREIFNAHEFHHLPVVEEGIRLVGLISKEDFFRLSYVMSLNTTGRTYSEMAYNHLKAKDIMTEYPISLEPEDTIGLAADIFLANKFHALPILEGETLVGIVTSHDLLRYSFASPVEATDTSSYEE